MTELAIIQDLTPAIFTEVGGLDKLLEDIKKRVANFNADVETSAGRDAIKSFAFQIAKTKTGLDNLGKDCVADWKAKSKLVDAERTRVWNILEDLQKQVRKPVTDWEQAEENRVNNLKQRIQDLAIPVNPMDTSERLKVFLSDINSIAIDESFQELAEVARTTKEATISALNSAIAIAEKREADAMELARLKKEAEERAQKDREEAIRREAEERAKREAEVKIKAEQEAAAKREFEAKLEAERKEQEIKAAAAKAAQEAEAKMQAERQAAERKELELKLEAEKAQREKLEAEQRAARAVEEERQRVAAEQARLAAEEAKREANTKHKAAIHNKVIEAFLSAGISSQHAELALNAICQGLVPNVTISY